MRKKTGMVFFLVCAAAAFADGPYTNNWPTYASTPLQHWPKASEYDALVKDMTWTYLALEERAVAADDKDDGYPDVPPPQPPNTNGTNLPKDDIHSLKNTAKAQIPHFADDARYEEYTSLSGIPLLTVAAMTNRLGLAEDFFDVTPARCLYTATAPEYPAKHGLPDLAGVVARLKWTKRRLAGSGGNNAVDVETKAVQDYNWFLDFDTAVASTRGRWNLTDWTGDNLWDEYYTFQRAVSHPDNYGFVVYVGRCKSTPQCHGIQVPAGAKYGWETYLLPYVLQKRCKLLCLGDEWTNDELVRWYASEEDTTAKTIQAARIQELPRYTEDYPMDVYMAYESFNPVKYEAEITCWIVEWLLKWDFKYK